MAVIDRLVVVAWAANPLSGEGVAAMLATQGDLDVVSLDKVAWADVALVVGTGIEPGAAEFIDQVYLRSSARIVLVIDELTDADVRLAATRPVMTVLPRSQVTREILVDTIRAVHEERAVPSLLDQVERAGAGRLRPRGAAGPLLTGRGQEVLRLLADGCDTTEIAKRMAYSERTVKNIIRQIFDRLGCRTRAHAVAFAIREGVI